MTFDVIASPWSELAALLHPLNTYEEVAEACRCSKRTVERAALAGELEIVRRGVAQRPLIPRAAVLRWLGLVEGASS